MKEISERQVEVLKSLSEVYHKCHKEAEGRLWNRIRENIPAAVVKINPKPTVHGPQSAHNPQSTHGPQPTHNYTVATAPTVAPGVGIPKANRENPVILMAQEENVDAEEAEKWKNFCFWIKFFIFFYSLQQK